MLSALRHSMKSVRAAPLSRVLFSTIKSDKLIISKTATPKPLPDNESLVFGHTFTDHMLEIDYSAQDGFSAPLISPFHDLAVHPAASCLHYGLQCFEGMKAYIGVDGKIRLFRPIDNMLRMNESMKRIDLPEIDSEELLSCIKKFVKLEERWIPKKRGYSLYLRPTAISLQPTLGVAPPQFAKVFVIASPVGPYFKEGFKPVSLLATTDFVRAWPGGTGNCKVGGNYAMTIMPQRDAMQKGFNQVLWLFGEEHYMTEVGTMNMFVYWKTKDGKPELVTAPLDGTILPGVTRKSILDLAKSWGEFDVVEKKIKMEEFTEAVDEGRVIECFGAGTACIVTPIKNINYHGKDYAIPLDPADKNAVAGKLTTRLNDTILDIQYGDKTYKDWSVVVD